MPAPFKLKSDLTRREYVHSALTVLLRDFGYMVCGLYLLNADVKSNSMVIMTVRDVLDAAERLIPLLRDDEYFRRYTAIMADNDTIKYKGE